MRRYLRTILILTLAALVVLWVVPSFISVAKYKEGILQLARELNIELTIRNTHLTLLPNPRIVLSGVSFKTLQPTKVLAFDIEGSSPQATIEIGFLGLIRGVQDAWILLENPAIKLKPTFSPLREAPAQVLQAKHVALNAIGLKASNGSLTYESEETQLAFQLQRFQLQKFTDNDVIRVETRLRLPKTTSNKGFTTSFDLRFGINFRVDLPWTKASTLNILNTRLEVRNLSYQSKRYHIRQQDAPLFLTLANLDYSPSRNGSIELVSMILGEQTLSLSGRFQPSPFLFVGELKPFRTSFDQFPFRILQDTYPGAKGDITLEAPLSFAYEGKSKSVPFPVWKIQLDGLSLSNAELPLPWFLIAEDSLTPRGQIHYTPKTETGFSKIKLLDASIESPNYVVNVEGTYIPTDKRGSLLLKPFDVDLTKLSTVLSRNYDLRQASGKLHIPSAMVINFTTTDDGRLDTTIIGRMALENVQGIWKDRWEIDNFSGDLLFQEKHMSMRLTADTIWKKRLKTDEKFVPTQIKTLNVLGNIAKDGTWLVQEATCSVNDGQIKAHNVTWNPKLQALLIDNAQIIYSDIVQLLSMYGDNWDKVVSGLLRINATKAIIPLIKKNIWHPLWSESKGDVEVTLSNFSWKSLRLKHAFSDFMESYLTHFKVFQTLAREKAPDVYRWDVDEQFESGSFQVSLDQANVNIENMTLKSSDVTLKASGTLRREAVFSSSFIDLRGSFQQKKPGFLYGRLRRIMLENDESINLPIQISGTLQSPFLSFREEEAFQVYDQRAKVIFPSKK